MNPETPTERRARIIKETRQEYAAIIKLQHIILDQAHALAAISLGLEKEDKEEVFYYKDLASNYQTVINARAEMVRQVTALFTLVDKFDNPQP